MKTARRKLGLLLLALVLTLGFAPSSFAGVGGSNTATGTNGGAVKWDKVYRAPYTDYYWDGTQMQEFTFQASGTPPVVDGNNIYIAVTDTLYKLDKETGEVAASTVLAGNVGYATMPVTVADGKVFVPMNEGKVEALDTGNLSQLWTYESPTKGQTISPVIYKNGKVYCGDMSGYGYGTANTFYCVDASNGNKIWEYAGQDPYWTGAYVADGDIALFTTSGSELITIGPDGTKLDGVAVSGLQNSTIVEGDGALFFTTTAGMIYRVSVAANGAITIEKSEKFSNNSVANTPVYSNGKIYVGDGNYMGGGYIYQIDAATLKTDYSVKAEGGGQGPDYPIQGEICLSQNIKGEPIIYAAYNNKPGGLFYMIPGETAAVESGVLFTPAADAQEFGTSHVVADDTGTIYYKNDSGHYFAIRQKYLNVTATWTPEEGGTVALNGATGNSNQPAAGGSVTASAIPGDDVTATITPAEGYKVKDVKVAGKSVGAVTSYTLKDIQKASTVSVVFEEEERVPVGGNYHPVVWDPNGGVFVGEGPDGTDLADADVWPRYGDYDIVVRDAPTRKGYTFLHWKGPDGKKYMPGDAYHVTEVSEFVAQWQKNDSGKVTPIKKDGPKTGDTAPVELIAGICAAAAALLALLVILSRRNREK